MPRYGDKGKGLMTSVDMLGLTAAVVSTGMAIPQLVKMIKTKRVADVSITMFLLNLVGVVLWFAYGVALGSKPIIYGNVISFFVVVLIIYYKFKHSRVRA